MKKFVKNPTYSCSTPSFSVVLFENLTDGFQLAGFTLEFKRTDGSYVSVRNFRPDHRSDAYLAYFCSVNNILSAVV